MRAVHSFLIVVLLAWSVGTCARRSVGDSPGKERSNPQRVRLSPIGSMEIPPGYGAFLSRSWPDSLEGCVRRIAPASSVAVITFIGEVGRGTLGAEVDYAWVRQEGGLRYGLTRGEPRRLVIALPSLKLEAFVADEGQINWAVDVARTFRPDSCPACPTPIGLRPTADPALGFTAYEGCRSEGEGPTAVVQARVPFNPATMREWPEAAQSPQDPTEADWSWVTGVQKRVFDSLLPVELTPRQLVAYRSYPEFMAEGVMERHFGISRGSGVGASPDAFTASIVTPVGRSINRQLLDLRSANRTAPFEEIFARITVRRFVVDSNGCPALNQRMHALAAVSIPLPFGDWKTVRIFRHPIAHRIVVRSDALTIDATDVDAESPLVRWAVRTNDELIACGR